MRGGRRGSNLHGLDQAAATTLSRTRSCKLPLRVPLYSLAGSGLGGGGFIVAVDLHETARSGVTAYWGCLRFQQLWALWPL
jgi:hypothetical protein